jgi:hypothetical protein
MKRVASTDSYQRRTPTTLAFWSYKHDLRYHEASLFTPVGILFRSGFALSVIMHDNLLDTRQTVKKAYNTSPSALKGLRILQAYWP